MATIYRLAQEAEMPRLLAQYAFDDLPVFPTLVADRDGQFMGVLGTLSEKEFIISGPFYADSPIVMINLLKAYRNTMRLLGVDKYYFFVDKTNERWLKQVRKLKIMVERVDLETEDLVWFETYIDYPYGVRYKFPREVH